MLDNISFFEHSEEDWNKFLLSLFFNQSTFSEPFLHRLPSCF